MKQVIQNVEGVVVHPVSAAVHTRSLGDVEALACHAVDNLRLLGSKDRLACPELSIDGYVVIRVPVDPAVDNDMLDEGLGPIDARHVRILVVLELLHSVIVCANIREFRLPRHAGDKKKTDPFEPVFEQNSEYENYRVDSTGFEPAPASGLTFLPENGPEK